MWIEVGQCGDIFICYSTLFYKIEWMYSNVYMGIGGGSCSRVGFFLWWREGSIRSLYGERRVECYTERGR